MTAPTHARAQHVDSIAPPDDTLLARRLPRIGSRMLVSRIIGGLFLLRFLTYGPGSMLMTSVVGDEGFLPGLPATGPRWCSPDC